jgi:hypothetical protein
MIQYSGNVWGSKPVIDDLSHCATYADYLSKLQMTLRNAYRALRPGGHYSLLIGDLRKNGRYYHISSDIRQLAPGELTNVIIKEQYNCGSDKTTYNDANLIRIAHEYILTFKKPERSPIASPLNAALATSTRLQSLADANWRSLTDSALRQLGGRASLEQICAFIRSTGTDSASQPNWTAKIKQSLTVHGEHLGGDIWRFKAA